MLARGVAALDTAARRSMWAASLHAARPAQGARATRCGQAHGEITASCATAHREATGDGRVEDMGQGNRQRGVAGGELGTTVCKIGTPRKQLWTPRRGAIAWAAYLHAARPERDARATRCGKAHGEITTSRATAPREPAGGGREEHVGQGGRPGSEAMPAVNREKSLRIWRAAREALDAAAQRNSAGRIFARPQDRSETRKQRGVASAHGEITALCATARRGRKPGPRRPAGQRGAPGGDSRAQSAQWARGAGICGRRGAAQHAGRGREALPAEDKENGVRRWRACRGAAQQHGPHLCTSKGRCETNEQRNLARCTFGRRGEAQPRGPHLLHAEKPQRGARATRRSKARGEITT